MVKKTEKDLWWLLFESFLAISSCRRLNYSENNYFFELVSVNFSPSYQCLWLIICKHFYTKQSYSPAVKFQAFLDVLYNSRLQKGMMSFYVME